MSRDDQRYNLSVCCLGNLTIFGGPELLKISKAIDLSCQSIENARARAVWQPRLPGVSLVGPTTAMLKEAEHQTVSSKANPSTPFGTFLAVKTVRARHVTSLPIAAVRSRTWENTTCLRAQELKHSKTHDLERSEVAIWRQGRCSLGTR